MNRPGIPGDSISVRGWSYEQVYEIFAGSPRAGGAAGGWTPTKGCASVWVARSVRWRSMIKNTLRSLVRTNRLMKSMKTSAVKRPVNTRKREVPRLVIVEITLQRNRWSVSSATGVWPFNPQLVPDWWSQRRPISSIPIRAVSSPARHSPSCAYRPKRRDHASRQGTDYIQAPVQKIGVDFWCHLFNVLIYKYISSSIIVINLNFARNKRRSGVLAVMM